MRQELYLEEQEEAERQKEMAEIERRIRQRLDLQQTHAEQLRLKEMKRQAEQAEEDEFRRNVSMGLGRRTYKQIVSIFLGFRGFVPPSSFIK